MHTTIHSNRQSSLPKMHILEEAGVPRKKPLQAKGVPPVLVWIVQTSHRKARVCIRIPNLKKCVIDVPSTHPPCCRGK